MHRLLLIDSSPNNSPTGVIDARTNNHELDINGVDSIADDIESSMAPIDWPVDPRLVDPRLLDPRLLNTQLLDPQLNDEELAAQRVNNRTIASLQSPYGNFGDLTPAPSQPENRAAIHHEGVLRHRTHGVAQEDAPPPQPVHGSQLAFFNRDAMNSLQSAPKSAAVGNEAGQCLQPYNAREGIRSRHRHRKTSYLSPSAAQFATGRSGSTPSQTQNIHETGQQALNNTPVTAPPRNRATGAAPPPNHATGPLPAAAHPSMRPNRGRYTDSEQRRFDAMYHAGMSDAYIAAQLGRSINAIEIKRGRFEGRFKDPHAAFKRQNAGD